MGKVMTFGESEWGYGLAGFVYVTALALEREREELEQEPEGRTRDYFFQRPRPFSKDKGDSEYGPALVQYTQVPTHTVGGGGHTVLHLMIRKVGVFSRKVKCMWQPSNKDNNISSFT